MTEEVSDSGGSEESAAPEAAVEEAPELFGLPGTGVGDMNGGVDTQLNSAEVKEILSESSAENTPQGVQVEGQQETEAQAESEATRTIKLANGQEFPNTTPVMLNGQEVPLQDLVNDYVGNKEIQRRFSEFDRSKKAWEAELIDRFKQDHLPDAQRVAAIKELASSGDYFGALNNIAEVAGSDPVDAEQRLVAQSLEIADKFTDMSEEEVKTYWAERKAEQVRKKLEAKESEEESKTTKTQQETQIKGIIGQYGLNEAQFSEAYTFLKQHEDVMGNLKNQTIEQATKTVCTFYLDSAKESRVVAAVNDIAGEHPDKDKLISMLYKVAEYDYSVDDIKEIAGQYLKVGTNPAKTKQVEETPSTPSVPQSEAKPASSSGISDLLSQEPEDALGWDFT